MDSDIIEHLEAQIASLQDTDSMELNEFEDSDLAMYPAIEIPQINLTADQCETIANNIIQMISTGDRDLIAQAARAMPMLAYNALMDREGYHHRNNAVPFFHKYNTDEYTEDWLRISGTSDVGLETLSRRQIQESNFDLVLVNPGASEFERKASIGAWAFSYLKSLRSEDGIFVRDFHNLIEYMGREGINSLYHFDCAYRFPCIIRNMQSLFNEECRMNKPGEMMYLLYRSAIVLETIQQNRSMQCQRCLLVSLVFGGIIGLRYGGLRLWTLLKSASEKLHISEKQLLDDLDWALKDPRWIRYSSSSLKQVELLREFHRKFEEENESRYYMYARVVNHHYFNYLGSKTRTVVSIVLKRLALGSRALSSFDSWGHLIAHKIQEFRSLDYKIAGLHITKVGIDLSQFDWVADMVLNPSL